MQHSARDTGLYAHPLFATTLVYMDFTIKPVPDPGQGVTTMSRRRKRSRRSDGDCDRGGEDGCGGGGLMRLLMVLK